MRFVRSIESDYARAAIAREDHPKKGQRRECIGNNEAAILYRIAFVWYGRGARPDGFIDKTNAQMKRECGLTDRMLEKAIKNLEPVALIEVCKVKPRNGGNYKINAYRVPDAAKVWLAKVVAKRVLEDWADDNTKQAERLREKAGAYLHGGVVETTPEPQGSQLVTPTQEQGQQVDNPRGYNLLVPHKSTDSHISPSSRYERSETPQKAREMTKNPFTVYCSLLELSGLEVTPEDREKVAPNLKRLSERDDLKDGELGAVISRMVDARRLRNYQLSPQQALADERAERHGRGGREDWTRHRTIGVEEGRPRRSYSNGATFPERRRKLVIDHGGDDEAEELHVQPETRCERDDPAPEKPEAPAVPRPPHTAREGHGAPGEDAPAQEPEPPETLNLGFKAARAACSEAAPEEAATRASPDPENAKRYRELMAGFAFGGDLASEVRDEERALREAGVA